MTADTDNGYRLVSALFLRLLGGIYLIAFASIGVQIEGLTGSQGIMPVAERLAAHAQQSGPERYLQFPTLFWLDASDAALTGVTVAGCIAALLIILNWWSLAARIAAFILYLSLFQACQPFLNFQWDTLLLETGFLAIFLTPRSRAVILLFRWLLFRLRFLSGLSKLVSGDPAWSELAALNTYFEVQPLPNPLAWYVHQLPEWLLRTGTAATLVIEILVPFMMFLPRRWRFAAAWITILWQVLIILTSNHNWINFLTIILCLFLFDDRALRKILPASLLPAVSRQAAAAGMVKRHATGLLAAFILVTSSMKVYELATNTMLEGWPRTVLGYVSAYAVVNKYHVFPTMTTQRIELEIQGSHDGKEWKTYEFRYKPDGLDERPRIIIPHQPRLDWQMWFVTLHPRHLPWFEYFLDALLDNSPAVTALLQHNPFPDKAPQYLRVNAWRYNFTDREERDATGHWWKRTALGAFSPLPFVSRQNNPAN